MGTKLHKLIKNRYSPRAFSPKMVEEEKVRLLIEAAQWAASSRNEQPARFIIGEKGSDFHEKIYSTLTGNNRDWNAQVPLLIMTLVKVNNTYKDKPNFYAQHDLGLAIGNMSIQAMSMDLYVHQMGGFDKALARELFEIPESFLPMTIIAVGYLGDLNKLPDELKKRELQVRTRKNQEEIIFKDDWNKLL